MIFCFKANASPHQDELIAQNSSQPKFSKLAKACSFMQTQAARIFRFSSGSMSSPPKSTHLVQTAGKNCEQGQDFGLSKFGGKYAGLQKLRELLQDSGASIPEYVGLSFDDIESALQTQKLPSSLQRLTAQFKADPRVRFMVRSSSTLEDQAGQSNAGCFESVSNVENSPEALLEAIRQVNESFYTENAKIQTSLYNNEEQGIANHGAIVIQRMVGESVPNAVISVSGVGLSPDPRSHAPGTFNINAALGHGEAVVQGLVPTDETLGIINPKTQEVYARTKVALQSERLVPAEGGVGLELAKNPDNLTSANKLTAKAIETYAQLLDKLALEHPTGVDMEFVAVGNELSVVQQRSQDVVQSTGQPQFLSDQFLESHEKKVNEVKVKSFTNYGVNSIAPEQRIIADSLNKAFFEQYIDLKNNAQSNNAQSNNTQSNNTQMPNIKAVFVSPPANPNSHAALLFRQQNIAIVEINDKTAAVLRENQLTDLVLDEQRALLLMQVQPKTQDLTTGMLKYPAEPVYSMPNEPTPISAQTLEALHFLAELARAQTETDFKNTSTLGLIGAINDEINKQTPNQEKAQSALAQLFKKTNTLLFMAKKTNNTNLIKVALEMRVDLARLSQSFKQQSPAMQKLLLLNWVHAAVSQMPEKHQDLSGIHSIKSALAERKTKGAFKGWFSAVAFHHAALRETGQLQPHHRDPNKLSSQAKAAAVVLHRVSYGIAQPEIKNFWLLNVSALLRDARFSEAKLQTLANTSLQRLQDGAFEAMVGDARLQDEFTLDAFAFMAPTNQPNPSVAAFKSLNQHIARLSKDWDAPIGFADRLAVLQQGAKHISNLTASLEANRPFAVMSATKQLEVFVEQVDLALKSIMTSVDYLEESREDHFNELLTLLHTLTKPILEIAYREGPFKRRLDSNGQFPGYYQVFEQHMAKLQKQRFGLAPSQHFNLGQTIIARSVTENQSSPVRTTGDLHTLLHQNLRMALGQIAVNYNALKTLPERAEQLHFQIKKTLPGMFAREHPISKKGLVLTSLAAQTTGFTWQYALPLREHGMRIACELDNKSNKLKVAVSMGGENENNRYSVAMKQIQWAVQTKLSVQGFQQGKSTWIEPETADTYCMAWEENLDQDLADVGDHIATLIAHVANTSYDFSDSTFDSGNDPFLYASSISSQDNEDLAETLSTAAKVSRIYKMLTQKTSRNLTALLVQGEREKLADFLLLRLQKTPPANDAAQSLIDQYRPLKAEIDRQTLLAQIDKQGLAQGKIGIFEFIQSFDIYTSPAINQAVKTFVSKNPNLIHLLFTDQLEQISLCVGKLQATFEQETMILEKLSSSLALLSTIKIDSNDTDKDSSTFTQVIDFLVTRIKNNYLDRSALKVCAQFFTSLKPREIEAGLHLADQYPTAISAVLEQIDTISGAPTVRRAMLTFLAENKTIAEEPWLLHTALPHLHHFRKLPDYGTVQGSQLSPLVYALENFIAFAIQAPEVSALEQKAFELSKY